MTQQQQAWVGAVQSLGATVIWSESLGAYGQRTVPWFFTVRWPSGRETEHVVAHTGETILEHNGG